MSNGILAAMDITSDGHYSNVKVLQSAAGYYIGTIFHGKDGFDEPGSRESEEYYKDKIDAEFALETKIWTQREYP